MLGIEKTNFGDNASFGVGKVVKDGVEFTGLVRFVLKDKQGKIISDVTRIVKNTVCNDGLETIADACSDRGITLPSHMAVGTTYQGKTGASTTLVSEVGGSRTALTSTTQGTGGNINKVTWVCTFAAGVGTGALAEAGIFNQASGGKMFCYTDFPVINKTADMSLEVTWVLSCGTLV